MRIMGQGVANDLFEDGLNGTHFGSIKSAERSALTLRRDSSVKDIHVFDDFAKHPSFGRPPFRNL